MSGSPATRPAGAYQFPCHACGSGMVFDPDTGMLLCPQCASTVPIPPDETDIVQYEFDPLQTDYREDDAPPVIECRNCGARAALTGNIVSQTCPFCGSAQIVQLNAFEGITPRTLIPFKITRQKAEESFCRWMGKTVPRPIRKMGRMGELYGVYVPMWGYTASIDIFYTGINRDYGEVSGQHTRFLNNFTVPASRYIDAELLSEMSGVEMAELVPYRPEYLAGFYSEYHSIGLHEGWDIATERIREREKGICRSGGVYHPQIDICPRQIRYIHFLMPVWITSLQYKGKSHAVMIDGRTGHVRGKLPGASVDMDTIVRVILGVLIIAGFILLGLLRLK